MAESGTSDSIEHLAILLQSKDIKDKSIALTALSQLAEKKEIINDMLENEIHLILMRLLRPFKKDDDSEDMVDGEEDENEDSSKPSDKLSPPLINEVLQILNHLIADDENEFVSSIAPESFRRIINVLKDEKYQKICQINVYSLIEDACEIEPDILINIIDEIELKLPTQKDAINAFLRLFARITVDLGEIDGKYFKKVAKSNLLNQILSLINNNNDKTSKLIKINCYEILYNLSESHALYIDEYGDDDDDDEDDDIKDKDKEKDKEEMKTYYDWIGKYNDNFCEFMNECLSKQNVKEIEDGIIKLTKQITSDMDEKWGDKNTNNKTTDSVVANIEDIKKWTKEKTQIIDKINQTRIGIALYLKIFQNGDNLILDKKDENKENDDDENENEDETEKERKRKKKSILSMSSRNNICCLIINNWLNIEFDTNKLIEISGAVGIDFKPKIIDLLKSLKVDQINFISEFLSDSIVSISSSQWQNLFVFVLKWIAIDNKQSKIDIIRRQKQLEKMKEAESKQNDDEMEENGNVEDEDDVFSARDDGEIGKILKNVVIECGKELNVTSSNIDELLILHGRMRNNQSRQCQFALDNFNKSKDWYSIDLIHVNDVNEYQLEINKVLTNLFKLDTVKTNKDYQRSILNALYEDVEILNKNIDFVDVLIKYYKENKDKNNDKNENNESWNELLEQWQGGDAMCIGFETIQLILDIMSINDEYNKLSINKKRFESICKKYKISLEKWKELKIIIDEFNKKMEEQYKKKEAERKEKQKNKKKKDNDDEDDDDDDIMDYGDYRNVEWEEFETITKGIEESLINIDKFLESQK